MSKSTEIRKLVRLSVVAEAYDVHERTVRQWVSEGRIAGYRVGERSLRVDPAEVEEFMARRIPAVQRNTPAV